MGKGNRARDARAEEQANAPELFASSRKNRKSGKISGTTIAFCIVIVFVLAVVLWSLIQSTGVIGRVSRAVESKNMAVSENELSVYEFQAMNVAKNQYMQQYYYMYYGMMEDTEGALTYYKSLYSDMSQQAQAYAENIAAEAKAEGLLKDAAYEFAIEYLTYCEGATSENYQYDDAAIETKVDEYIKSLEEQAKAYQISFGDYVSSYMNKGVSRGDIRSAMDKYYRAVEFRDILSDRFSDGTKDDELTKYRDDHKSEFYTSTYDSYVIKDETMKKYFEGLDGKVIIEDSNDLSRIVLEYVFNEMYDEQYEKYFTEADPKVEDKNAADTKTKVLETIKALSKLHDDKCEDHEECEEDSESYDDYKEHFKKDGTGEYNKAAYEVVNAINTTVKAQLQKISKDASANYSDPSAKDATDLNKFLFADGTKEGATTIITTNDTTDSSKKIYTFYIAREVMKLDDECTKVAGYLLLKDDDAAAADKKTAEKKATEFISELNNAKTREKFEELVEKYSEGSTAIYEQVSEKSLANDDLAAWLFDDARKANDITSIKADTGYYVAIYLDENEMTWKITARESVTTEKLDAWFEQAKGDFGVVAHTDAPTTTAAPAA